MVLHLHELAGCGMSNANTHGWVAPSASASTERPRRPLQIATIVAPVLGAVSFLGMVYGAGDRHGYARGVIVHATIVQRVDPPPACTEEAWHHGDSHVTCHNGMRIESVGNYLICRCPPR